MAEANNEISSKIRNNLLERTAREINWFGYFDQLRVREDSPIFVRKNDLKEEQKELLERLLRFGERNGEDLVYRSGLLNDAYIPGIALLEKITAIENKRVEELHQDIIEECKQFAFLMGYDSIREWVVDKIPATMFNNDVVFTNVEKLDSMHINMLDALHYSDSELITTDTARYKEHGVAYIADGKLAKMLMQKLDKASQIDGSSQTAQGAKLYEFKQRGREKE